MLPITICVFLLQHRTGSRSHVLRLVLEFLLVYTLGHKGEKRSSTTCISVMVGWLVGVCTFALFAQIVNFDMVSNILNALVSAMQRFSNGPVARHGIPLSLSSNRHVIEDLEIANNLNLNTYDRAEEVFVSRSHQNHIQLIATNTLVYCSLAILLLHHLLLRLLLLLLCLLLLLPHQTWVDFGHIEKGIRRRKLGHLVEVERVFCLEVDLHQSRRRRWWCHFPSFRSVVSGDCVFALRRRVVLLTTAVDDAAAAAVTGGSNRGISLWWLRRSLSGVELRWWRCRTGSMWRQRRSRRRLDAATAERFLLAQLAAATRRYDRVGRGRAGQR